MDVHEHYITLNNLTANLPPIDTESLRMMRLRKRSNDSAGYVWKEIQNSHNNVTHKRFYKATVSPYQRISIS